ncbi:MAG: ABC transporter substrate-binding protein [Clostridiales bacterium]|nr:ABC transporter substrate-binding protein [Clostridiales bacterium]
MRKLKKLATIALTAVMAASLLTGCGGSSSSGSDDSTGSGSSSSSSSESSSTLKFGCLNYSESLDPANMINAAWANSRYGIGECLFKFNDDMTVEETLCDSYEVSDDHITWTLHIREGVKFSNGNDVTPSAVQACWEVLYANEEGSSTPTKYMDYESMEADDEAMTLTITLKEAQADLTMNLAYPVFVVLDVSVDDLDLDDNPIGTGPYAITSYSPNESVSLAANEYYWNGEVPYDNVEITFIDDSSTKAMALQSGDVNLVENVTTASDLEALESDDNYTVSIAQGVRCGFAYINQDGILADDTLRHAIMKALDDETMCEITVGGMYTEGYSVLPSGLDYGYDELTDVDAYDTDAAIALLDDAGYVDTDGDGIREINGENISLNYITYDSRCLTDFAAAIQTTLSDIGIGVTVNTLDADSEWNQMVAGEYDLCSSNWTTVGNGDPTEYLANWYSKSDANYCNYANDEFDAAYEVLLTGFDEDERTEAIKTMQQILIDDAAVVVHGYYNSSMIADSTVTGANIHTADYYWLTTEIAPAE